MNNNNNLKGRVMMSGRSLHHIFLTVTTVIVFFLCLLVLNNNNNNNSNSNDNHHHSSSFVSASVTYCQNRLHGIAQYGKCYIKASFNSEAWTPDVMADGTLQVESDGELTLVNKNYYRPWAQYAFVNGVWRWRNGQPAEYTAPNWRYETETYPTLYALNPSRASGVYVSSATSFTDVYLNTVINDIQATRVNELKLDPYCHSKQSHVLQGRCIQWNELYQYSYSLIDLGGDLSTECPTGFNRLMRPRNKQDIRQLATLIYNDATIGTTVQYNKNRYYFLTDITTNDQGTGYVYSDGTVPTYIEGLPDVPPMELTSNGTTVIIDLATLKLRLVNANKAPYNTRFYTLCEHVHSTACESMDAHYYRGACYKNVVSSSALGFNGAVDQCINEGFDGLASIEDQASYAFMHGIIDTTNPTVVDAKYQACTGSCIGSFVNSDGKPTGFVDSSLNSVQKSNGALLALQIGGSNAKPTLISPTGTFTSFICSKTIQCFGVDSTNPAVCSGRGKCVSEDRCQCDDENYIGDRCQARKRDLSQAYRMTLGNFVPNAFVVTESDAIYGISSTSLSSMQLNDDGTVAVSLITPKPFSQIAFIDQERYAVFDGTNVTFMDGDSVTGAHTLGSVDKIATNKDSLFYIVDPAYRQIHRLDLSTLTSSVFLTVDYYVESMVASSTTIVVTTIDDWIIKYDISSKKIISRVKADQVNTIALNHLDNTVYVLTYDEKIYQWTTYDKLTPWTPGLVDDAYAIGFSATGDRLYLANSASLSIVPLSCERGYLAPYCFQPMCFGFPASSRSVCSGSGQCVAPDHCVCSNSATNRDCSGGKTIRGEIRQLTSLSTLNNPPTSGAPIQLNGHGLIMFCDNMGGISMFNRSSSQISQFVASGNCYTLVPALDSESIIVSMQDSTIVRIDLQTQVQTILAGSSGVEGATDGFYVQSTVSNVQSIAIDPMDPFTAIFVNNFNGERSIRKLDLFHRVTTTISELSQTISSNAPYSTTARTILPLPYDLITDAISVAFFGTNLLIASPSHHYILTVDLSTMRYHVKVGGNGAGDSNGFVRAVKMNQPTQMSVNDLNGDIYVVYEGRSVIKAIGIDDRYRTFAGQYDSNEPQPYFVSVNSAHFDAASSSVIVFDTVQKAIMEIELIDPSAVAPTTTCFGIVFNSTNVCSGRGSCVANDVCVCQAGSSGANCQDQNSNITSCFGIMFDDDSVCSGNGVCQANDDCTCEPNYSGSMCETYTNVPPLICYGVFAENPSVCSGQGNCTSEDNCSCFDGYSGGNCELSNMCYGWDPSASEACSGHGTCLGNDNCQCYPQYYGEQCQYHSQQTSCYGIPATDGSVCSNRGTCTSQDHCVCNAGYEGKECEEITPPPLSCHGILATDESVCSGNGNCSFQDYCVCMPGYEGAQCQDVTPLPITCNGTLATDELVCSGRGNCTSQDHCECDDGYEGAECQTVIPPPLTCFGILATDGSVCSEHGNCTSPDHCVCASSFAGLKCEFFKCYGEVASSSSACSGNGTCVAVDTCVCNSKYYGERCEFYNNTTPVIEPTVQIVDPSGSAEWFTRRTYNLTAAVTGTSETVTYSWSCVRESTGESCGTSSSRTARFIFSTAPAGHVTISVTVKRSSGSPISASINRVIISTAPFSLHSTPYTVSPKNGTSFDTQFTFTAFGWQANAGAVLTFNFEYYDIASKVWRTLYSGSQLSYRTQLISQQGSDSIQTALRVRTNFGDEVSTFSTITVMPRQISSSELTNQMTSTNWTAMSDSDKASTLLTIGAAYAQSGSTSPEFADSVLNTIDSVENISPSVANQLVDTLGLLASKPAALTDDQKPKILGSLKTMLKKVDIASGGKQVLTTAGQSISNIMTATSGSGANEEQLAKDGVETMRAITSCIVNSVQPGDEPVTISVEAFSLSVQKVFSDAVTPNISTSDDMSILVPSLNLPTDVVGLEYTAFNDIVDNIIWKQSLKNFSKQSADSGTSSEIQSSIVTFRVLDGDQKIKIETPEDEPLVITIKKLPVSDSDTVDLNQTTVCRYYDDQSENEWRTEGCWFDHETETAIVCHCNHTTSFAAFIQYSQSELSKSQTEISRAIYFVSMGFNTIFILVICVLLVFLIIHRNKQPIRSRIYAPVICLIALLVECCLQGIIRNALLSAKDRTKLVYPINVVGSIILIISCPLSIISLFVFFWQNIRQFFLKHFYYLSDLNYGKAAPVVMKLSAIISSKPIFYINVGAIWAVLFAYFIGIGVAGGVSSAKSNTISTAITMTSSITYLALLLAVGIGIVLTFVYDFVIVFMQERSRFNNISPDQTDIGKGKKHLVDNATVRRVLNLVPSFTYSHLIANDPLFFRIDSILITLAVLVGFVSFCAGIASEATKASNNSGARIVFLIFDLMYTILRIAAFGGGISIIQIVQMVKERNKTATEPPTEEGKATKKLEKDNEIIALITSKQPHFKEYCIKEQSLENYLAMIEVLEIKTAWADLYINEKRARIDAFYANYISYDGLYTLNISGKNRKSFIRLKETLDKEDSVESAMLAEIQTAVMTNLSDTFSRYSETDEYVFLTKQQAMHNRLQGVDLELAEI